MVALIFCILIFMSMKKKIINLILGLRRYKGKKYYLCCASRWRGGWELSVMSLESPSPSLCRGTHRLALQVGSLIFDHQVALVGNYQLVAELGEPGSGGDSPSPRYQAALRSLAAAAGRGGCGGSALLLPRIPCAPSPESGREGNPCEWPNAMWIR